MEWLGESTVPAASYAGQGDATRATAAYPQNEEGKERLPTQIWPKGANKTAPRVRWFDHVLLLVGFDTANGDSKAAVRFDMDAVEVRARSKIARRFAKVSDTGCGRPSFALSSRQAALPPRRISSE